MLVFGGVSGGNSTIFGIFHPEWLGENDPNLTIIFFSDGLVQLVQPSTRGSYCWWKKSGDRQLRLVGYPMIYRVLYIPGGCLEIIPSTVWCPRNLSIAEIRVVSNIVSWPNSWHLILKDVFFRYGGILLQFATAKRRQAMESVYIFSIRGGWSIAFLPVFVSRISVIDRVPPEFQASLKETQKIKPTWMKQGIFQFRDLHRLTSYCWWTKHHPRVTCLSNLGCNKTIEVHHVACFEFQAPQSPPLRHETTTKFEMTTRCWRNGPDISSCVMWKISRKKVARKGLKQALPPILFLGAAQPNYFIDTPQLVLDLNFNTFDQESKVDSLGRVKVVSNNLLGGWFWNYLRGMGAYVYSYF